MQNQQWTPEQTQYYQQLQQQGYSDEQIQQYFFQLQQQQQQQQQFQMQQQSQQNAGIQQNQQINLTNQQEIQQPQQFNLGYQPGYQTMNNFGMQQNFTQANQQMNQNISYLMQQNSQFQQNFYAQEMQKQQLTQQNAQLTSQVKSLQTKLRGEEEERERLETEKQTNTKKSTTTINKLKQDVADLTEKVLDVEFDCKQKEDKYQKVLKQFKDEKEATQNMKRQIVELQNTLADKESELQMAQKKFELTLSSSKSDTDNLFKGLNDEKTNEIARLKSQISQLKNELDEKNQQLKKLTEESEVRIKALEEEVSKEHRYFIQSKEEVNNWQKKNQQQQNQIKQKDQNIDDLQKQISSFKQEIKKLKTENQNLSDNLNLKINENMSQKSIIEKYQHYANNPKVANNDEINKLALIMQQMQNDYAAQQKQLSEKNQQNQAANEKEKQNQIKKQQDAEKQKAQKQLELKNSNKTLIKQLMSKATEVQGQLDICYVIDSTVSMEPYIQQARKCVRESLKIIKFQTNRDTNVSAVCYYDIEQKPKQGFYHQLDFTKDAQVLENFLDQMKTAGGRDIPEDVKGAFDQMLTNIQWKNKFRLAILITDAPCHGLKYHEASISDYHKDSDITSTLHNIVKNGIILIGFNLNQRTTIMYKEFEKVYKEIQKQDQFFMVDVQGQQVDKLAEQMAKTLGQASEQATQVKNTGTKSKKAQQERPQNKDGAMEALCKQGNFYNFEQQENVKVVDANFKVLKVEIVDKIFEENLQTINNIGKSQDHYKITDEGQWQCIRTDQPFAFGMMKDVFLMKKKNAMKDELFVIKTPLGSQPYKTQNDAINECRSHLICQKLVKKFREEIEKAKEEGNLDLVVPPVIYSDFLILQETNDRFWIAEKFFKGEFVKYNNNFGFINPDFDPLNKFAQAFSYYTFFISGGRYLVNDVQGVGNYFTDPAINTDSGDFDDTDLGLEGQQMFLVSFEWKHQLAYDYLNVLDIQFEIDDGKKNK